MTMSVAHLLAERERRSTLRSWVPSPRWRRPGSSRTSTPHTCSCPPGPWPGCFRPSSNRTRTRCTSNLKTCRISHHSRQRWMRNSCQMRNIVSVGWEIRVNAGWEIRVDVRWEISVNFGWEIRLNVGREIRLNVTLDEKFVSTLRWMRNSSQRYVGWEIRVKVGWEIRVNVGWEIYHPIAYWLQEDNHLRAVTFVADRHLKVKKFEKRTYPLKKDRLWKVEVFWC